jgi:hypothetical protein
MSSISAERVVPAGLADVPVDVRRAGRVLAAVLLPLGPALVAVLRFVLPYDTADDATTIARKIDAHQGAENAVVWLGFLAMVVLVPTVLWVGRVVGRRSPRLTAAALLLLVPGYAVLGFLVAGDAATLFAVKHGVSAHTAGQLYESMHPTAAIAGGVFVAGHVLGTVLLGIAMIRGRVVPLWAAVATLVAQPLHAFSAVVITSHPLDLVAWALNAVGFAAVSAVILRTDDDAWASAPEAVRS